MKRQKEKVGSFFKIPLDKKYHSYGRILNEGNFAFYDFKTDEDVMDFQKLASKPILFIAVVDSYSIKKGRWLIVGEQPLEASLQKNPPKYIKDIGDPNKFFIYENAQMYPASKEKCIGLEVSASWSPEQMEERLRDTFNGIDKRKEWGILV